MAARTEMNSLIAYTRALMPSVATTDVSDTELQTELDSERVLFNYVRLAHDADYVNYYTTAVQPAKNEIVRATQFGTRIQFPDFSFFYRAGFLDQIPTLRDGVTAASVAYTPNASDNFAGTYTFSAAPNIELYIYGWAYNPYRAAARALDRSAETGGRALRSVGRGRISYSYDSSQERVARLFSQGYYLNRELPRWERR